MSDISSDGKYLLFAHSKTPVHTYIIPLGGGRGKTNVDENEKDLLRVVERESGREVGRNELGILAAARAQFLPNNHVFFSVSSYQTWDPWSGNKQKCTNGDRPISSLVFPDDQRAIGFSSTKFGVDGEPLLASINLSDCSLTALGSVDPDNKNNGADSNLAISPDKKSIAYKLFQTDAIVIWDIEEHKVVKKLDPGKLFFGRKIIYTPDNKFMVVSASEGSRSGGTLKVYLRFYDRKSYELIRQLPIIDYDAIAISPNSQMFALSFQEAVDKWYFGGKTLPVIYLYDITTGKEIARTSFPSVRLTHNNGYDATIKPLMFTPDGNYLVASTFDARVWRIE